MIRMSSVAFLLVMLSGVAVAQDSPVGGCVSVMGESGVRQLVGLQICFKCHAAGPVQGQDTLAEQLGIAVDGGWIRGNELRVWGGEDRHSQAYATLLGETAGRIGRALGREGVIHRDVRCISCHSAYPISQLPAEDMLIGESQVSTDLRLTLGVSCEGCHGAAGDGLGSGSETPLRGWLNAHVNSDTWRYLSPEDKCRSGYSDVRSVVSRTRICVSCHIGDASMGRVLTHEMYAAGHPPLPPFELATFEDLMPRHWMDFGEKGEELRERYQQRAAVQRKEWESSQSRATVISALVVYGTFLRLTADLAGAGGVADEARPMWPEFAQFDCYACHHDLKSRSWRQTAQATGRPGRPRLVPWPASLARVMAAVSEGGGGFAVLERRLDESVLGAPFGDGVAVATAALELAAVCDSLALSFESDDWSADSRQRVLAGILAAGSGLSTPVADYDSARQYAWAFAVLQAEIAGEKRSAVVEEWFGSESGLSTRSGVPLLLDLKVGVPRQLLIPGAAKERSILQIDPQQVLPPIAGYNAVQFQAAFSQIQQKLAGEAAAK